MQRGSGHWWLTDFTLNAERIAELHDYIHEKVVNNSNPADVFESWKRQNSVSRSLTTMTGSVGGVSNALTTTTQTWTYSGGAESSLGDPPPPVPPAPVTDVLTTGLDYLQTGLDVAGMVPVVGEGADMLNAGIHLGRGNVGEATLSMAAMIPFAGTGVTTGKFANKIGKALTKNSDKLDNVMAGMSDIAGNARNMVGKAPPALPITRGPHGGPVHDGAIMDRLAELSEHVKDVRKNQKQVNAAGEKVSELLPDGQWTEDGVRHLLQVIDTNPATKVDQLMKADPLAVVEIIF